MVKFRDKAESKLGTKLAIAWTLIGFSPVFILIWLFSGEHFFWLSYVWFLVSVILGTILTNAWIKRRRRQHA